MRKLIWNTKNNKKYTIFKNKQDNLQDTFQWWEDVIKTYHKKPFQIVSSFTIPPLLDQDTQIDFSHFIHCVQLIVLGGFLWSSFQGTLISYFSIITHKKLKFTHGSLNLFGKFSIMFLYLTPAFNVQVLQLLWDIFCDHFNKKFQRLNNFVLCISSVTQLFT